MAFPPPPSAVGLVAPPPGAHIGLASPFATQGATGGTALSSLNSGSGDLGSDDEGGLSKEDRRKHHNALERKRRDHIKGSFTALRDQVPQLNGEKASRALILNAARDFITQVQGTNQTLETEVDDLQRQNELLNEQIRALELALLQHQQKLT